MPLVSQMSEEKPTMKVFAGRKLEMRTNCTIVNCGEIFVSQTVPYFQSTRLDITV